jgi:hypothetical protein
LSLLQVSTRSRRIGLSLLQVSEHSSSTTCRFCRLHGAARPGLGVAKPAKATNRFTSLPGSRLCGPDRARTRHIQDAESGIRAAHGTVARHPTPPPSWLCGEPATTARQNRPPVNCRTRPLTNHGEAARRCQLEGIKCRLDEADFRDSTAERRPRPEPNPLANPSESAATNSVPRSNTE